MTESWSPESLMSVETIDAGRVGALSALFESGLPTVRTGDVLPPLWHWAAIPQWAESSTLGTDGHPRTGDFMPPLPYPRRMFAGGEVTIYGDLIVGAGVRRTTVVESTEEKVGRSGPLAVVHVRTDLESLEGSPLLTERQDVIYLPLKKRGTDGAVGAPTAPTELAGAPLSKADGTWRFRTDPAVLMRFSAATANAHRIHYDWPYATEAEGYPGLVVQGPLVTMSMLESVRVDRPEALISRIRYRNINPLYCGEAAVVQLQELPRPSETVELSMLAGDNHSIVEATVEFNTNSGEAVPHA